MKAIYNCGIFPFFSQLNTKPKESCSSTNNSESEPEFEMIDNKFKESPGESNESPDESEFNAPPNSPSKKDFEPAPPTTTASNVPGGFRSDFYSLFDK